MPTVNYHVKEKSDYLLKNTAELDNNYVIDAF